MENPNMEHQKNQIKQNPTRFNTDVKQGQSNEKNLDKQSGQNRKEEVDTAKFDRDEIDLDRSGVGTAGSRKDANFLGGQETEGQQSQQQTQKQQGGETSGRVKDETKQAGAGVDYGKNKVQNAQPQQPIQKGRDKQQDNERRI